MMTWIALKTARPVCVLQSGEVNKRHRKHDEKDARSKGDQRPDVQPLAHLVTERVVVVHHRLSTMSVIARDQVKDRRTWVMIAICKKPCIHASMKIGRVMTGSSRTFMTGTAFSTGGYWKSWGGAAVNSCLSTQQEVRYTYAERVLDCSPLERPRARSARERRGPPTGQELWPAHLPEIHERPPLYMISRRDDENIEIKKVALH